jgi:antitoxin (DNA-binding transcriptional repressor) of toxin-antitoxin stability system
MKTATVRDLRNAFPQVARWIEEGECVEITRSGKPFARLAPVAPTETSNVPMPDFLGRLREKFPDENVEPGSGSVIDYDRGDR